MTIEEVKKRRDHLADDISRLVNEFQDDTKVEVSNIALDGTFQMLDGSMPKQLVIVEVKI